MGWGTPPRALGPAPQCQVARRRRQAHETKPVSERWLCEVTFAGSTLRQPLTPIDSPALIRVVQDLPAESRWVYRCAVAVVAMTFVVMFAGAEVTSTNSGMAFTTWPDAYGHYFWPHDPDLAGVLEHSHRLFGTVLGLLAIALVVTVFRKDPRPIMRKLSLGLLGLIIVQGLLGGYRVLLNAEFPVLFPVLHGSLAHVVFALGGIVAYVGSLAWVPRSKEDSGQVRTGRRLAVFALITVVVQIILGVIMRHSESVTAKWTHISFAAFAGISVLVAAAHSLGRFGKIPGFTRTNRILLTLLGAQILLGLIALVVRRSKAASDTTMMKQATMVSLHVVVGASLLLAIAVLVARTYRNLVPRAVV